MVKELVLKIDVSTAVDYLLQTKEDNSSVSLDQLAKKLKVLHYLSQRNKECNPKLQELQHQMKAWLQASGTQKPPSKVLVVITVDSNPLREMLITQLSGDVYAVVPAENNNFVDCRRVMESLKYSSCLVVCSRHIGADFPWHCFSVLVEYDDVESSRWTAVCRQMNICHMAFTTVSPISDPTITSSPLPFVKNVPFVLFVTEGLVNLSHLLQMLESVFNITVIERRLSPSLQMLEASHSYVVITVDESTAVLIQVTWMIYN
ncbi:protein shortage in chiasmata 1 ortholog isoform X2 [Denticeps clupeoides]|uniref:protein shortage in chiasmata 1 ortholog isoform X2 n=1 Tax=Denticeps clupeoides TaxID=299321 RepID=UPI0010A58E66|nr:protein shortage in chiasmata 1 ortholog isoform X2 [Denticeps clupeoides]